MDVTLERQFARPISPPPNVDHNHKCTLWLFLQNPEFWDGLVADCAQNNQTLTMVYHVTYRKINIRKETSTSISVFSMASYLSMVALLIQQHWDRSDWLDLPFVALGFRLLQGGGEIVVKVAEYANITVAS